MGGSIVSPVLVGRETELAATDAALRRALDGAAVTLVVGGEAGVGKSRLIGEFGRAYGWRCRSQSAGSPSGSLVAGPLMAVAGTTGAFAVAAAAVITVCGLLVRRPIVAVAAVVQAS